MASQHLLILRLARVLFPSWRFFDDLGESPRLSFRLESQGVWSSWTPVVAPKGGRWSSLFLNPRVHLFLAGQSLIERLADEVNEFPEADIQASVTYRLVGRWVLWLIRALPESKTGTNYQFRIDGMLESPVERIGA